MLYHSSELASERSPGGHGGYHILDLGVEVSVEFDHCGFWVRVARLSYQVLELVYVVI